MNKQAIFHITDIPYAYAQDENTLFLMLKTACADVIKCAVYYKDRYDSKKAFNVKDMEIKNSDGLFDYFEVQIHADKNRYMYFFEIKGADLETLYYDERGLHSKPLDGEGAFEFPYIAPIDVYKSPDWAQQAILYLIFPERFLNGDERNDPKRVLPWGSDVTSTSMFGGDLRGIINKLQYICDLGVTIIYMTPVFLSPSNHKYNTCDYYKIDPHFGDINTVRELTAHAHELGIKVIMDAVFNHCGKDFFAFKDVLKNQQNSKYKDWFFIDSFPVSTEKINYATFADNVGTMPKLNTGNPEVRDYLLDVSEYWIKEAGIDGWRLDVCDEVDHFFWREFRKRVKAAKPDAFIIGEIHHESASWLRGDQLDSIMNYPFRKVMVDFFAKRSINAEDMDNELSSKRALYMKKINMNLLNLLDSHDTPRFLTVCGERVERLKLAAAFQYTYIGLPGIYYGDEVGLSGANDPQCRKCMVWDEDKQDRKLINYYKLLGRIRKENKALVYGEYLSVYKKDSVLCYKRKLNDEEILVILNNKDEVSSIEHYEIAGEYYDLLCNSKVIIKSKIYLEPNDIKILKKCGQNHISA